jgi:hypothetical protein
VQLELELGLLATISPQGRLPQRAWYVVRAAVGPVRAEVLTFTEFVESRAAQHALARVLATAV